MDEKFCWLSAFDGAPAYIEVSVEVARVIFGLINYSIVWNKVNANISMLQTKGKESQQLQL